MLGQKIEHLQQEVVMSAHLTREGGEQLSLAREELNKVQRDRQEAWTRLQKSEEARSGDRQKLLLLHQYCEAWKTERSTIKELKHEYTAADQRLREPDTGEEEFYVLSYPTVGGRRFPSGTLHAP